MAELCGQVFDGVRSVVPARKLQAVVLGGGYGRGEGGVLVTEEGDHPYNDLEFYIFVRGNTLLNGRRHGNALELLSHALSHSAGLHVEFKIDSLRKLRSSNVSMFSYDLVSAHRILFGDDVFEECAHHLDPTGIPGSEATRLLFNRCTGLLLAREKLEKATFSGDDADFVGRNLAKAKLALGDAVLAFSGLYHWSCRERERRLKHLHTQEQPPQFDLIKQFHSEGVIFKLHPRRISEPRECFLVEHREIAGLAGQLWLWLESRRLKRPFASMQDYAFHSGEKLHQANPGRNFMLNLKTFGLGSFFDPIAWRYPRERLFNALSLLLWNDELSTRPDHTRHLQRQLRTEASDWNGLVSAYKNIWPSYG